jgi:hypothetical protein
MFRKIKSYFPISLLFIFFFSSGFSQITNDDYRSKISLGFKGGINIANVFDTDGEDFISNNRVGLAAGAFLHLPIGSLIGIQPEIMFSQKGFNGEGSLLGIDYEFSRTSNFIDLPILFAFKPIGGFTLFAGPQYSYLLSTSENISTDGLSLENTQEFENQDLRNNLLGFATGFDINLNQIIVGFRASWDLMQNSSDGSSEAPRYRNAVYQITAGFRF